MTPQTRSAILRAERQAAQRHRSYLVLHELYRSTPWYLLPERSMIRSAMRSLRPVSAA